MTETWLDLPDVWEEVEEKPKPYTTDDGEYCHIVDDSGQKAFCGRKQVGDLTCKPYNGEAICPSCGLPTCPTCAVRQSLSERLEG